MVLSSDKGLESRAHQGGDNRWVIVVCFGEFNCRAIDAGLCVLAARAFSKPIFICMCSAKNDVVIGEVVGLRISVSRTDDLAAVFGVVVNSSGFVVGVDNVAPGDSGVYCPWSLCLALVGVMLLIGDDSASMFIVIRSGLH